MAIVMEFEDYFDDFTRRDWQQRSGGDPVRFALIGLGWFTRDWALPGMEKAEFCEPTVAVSGSREKAQTVAGNHSLEHGLTYEEFHDGVGADAYDAVYVVTPNALHLEHVEAAAKLGKAVLCEKPMEATAERAERMVDICAEHGVTLMIAYRMHTEPAVRRTKELVQAGFIGDIVQIHGHMSQLMLSEIDTGDIDQWRLDQDLSGGCALMDIGIYPLNTSRFVLDADPTSVYGQTVTEHEPFHEVDEHVVFHLTFPDGVNAVCTASQNAYHSSQLRITGTDGQITLEPAFYEREAREISIERHGVETTLDFEQVDQLTEEFDYFSHCLLADSDPLPDGCHGLRDLQIIEAIYQSADTGVPVEL